MKIQHMVLLWNTTSGESVYFEVQNAEIARAIVALTKTATNIKAHDATSAKETLNPSACPTEQSTAAHIGELRELLNVPCDPTQWSLTTRIAYNHALALFIHRNPGKFTQNQRLSAARFMSSIAEPINENFFV